MVVAINEVFSEDHVSYLLICGSQSICVMGDVYISREEMERENVNSRQYTTAAALGTVMGKVFGLRSPHSSTLLDRCPTFVSKDKSLKAKLIGKTRKVPVISAFAVNPVVFMTPVTQFTWPSWPCMP